MQEIFLLTSLISILDTNTYIVFSAQFILKVFISILQAYCCDYL